MKARVEDCKIIDLPIIEDRAGNISPITGNDEIPFEIRRVFYLYDIPGGKDRGAHAHKSCHQFLIAGSGAFEVLVDDGTNQETYSLNRPYYGLHIPPGIWAAEKNFSSGSICLVLASHGYDAEDYVRNYEDYREFNA
jgi:hypothetical protein